MAEDSANVCIKRSEEAWGVWTLGCYNAGRPTSPVAYAIIWGHILRFKQIMTKR